MEKKLSDGLNDFKEYLEKYCKTYGKSTEEALADAVVVEVGRAYNVTSKEVSTHLLNTPKK